MKGNCQSEIDKRASVSKLRVSRRSHLD